MTLTQTALSAPGERLVLQHVRWAGVEDGVTLIESDTLEVHEIDAEGRLVAWIVFDPDDRRAAAIELGKRFARSDEARLVPAALFEFARAAWQARDAEAIRAVLPDDFVFDDHRRTGAGRIEGVDAYLVSVAALWEETRDIMAEMLCWLAIEPHGSLSVGRHFGTLRDGGEFEIPWVALNLFEGERLLGFELYEPEDLETARARFEALRRESTPAA